MDNLTDFALRSDLSQLQEGRTAAELAREAGYDHVAEFLDNHERQAIPSATSV